MNSMQVKSKLKNIEKENGVPFNTLLRFYVFDRFIVRLSKSEYKDNFIIKGGFLLSQLFDLNNRVTTDIDSTLNMINLTKDNVLKVINSIISIDLDDNVKFIINDIESIRDEVEYGGYRVHLSFQFENIKETLKLDVATGDLITPKEITLNYKTMLDNKQVKVWSYNVETVLAEKIETIFSKLEVSSRMKDYYDIYLIFNKSWDEINKNTFLRACKNTFEKRNLDKDLIEAFDIIRSSTIIRKRWEDYSKKYNYAKNINFDEVLKCIEQILEVLVPISI